MIFRHCLHCDTWTGAEEPLCPVCGQPQKVETPEHRCADCASASWKTELIGTIYSACGVNETRRDAPDSNCGRWSAAP
jgi:predicted amidophosphoribosyltransferase